MTDTNEILNRLEPFVHGLGKAVLCELRSALAQQPEPEIPDGALQQQEPYYSIGRKWIAYAQRENDSNDIAVSVWSAIREVATLAQQGEQQPVCKECGDTGSIYAADGAGPFDCYACGRKSTLHPEASND